MKRYTGKSLEADLIGMNETLARVGDPYRFVIGYRYNYTAIDLATPENAARHCTNRNLQCGTPRECLASCQAYLSSACAHFIAAIPA